MYSQVFHLLESLKISVIHNEKLLMQKAWREEDEKMRFDINRKKILRGRNLHFRLWGKNTLLPQY